MYSYTMSYYTSLLYLFTILAAAGAAPHVNYTVSNGCTVTQYSQVANAVASCTNIIINGITVPAGTTLKLNLKDSAKLTFEGHIKFERHEWKGPLVLLSGKSIFVQGASGAYLDGLGNEYWDGKGGTGSTKPVFFSIWSATKGAEVRNIYLKNCPERCTAIDGTDSLTLDNWTIDNKAGDKGVAAAGKEAYNTDGFDIADTTNLVIENVKVYNQDDCVAINGGSNLKFNNFYCHGSHGLSFAIGMNTKGENEAYNVVFSNSTLENGMVAIHVKTLPKGGTGFIKNVRYENIKFSGVTDYGINIEQDYVGGGGSGHTNDNIKISKLVFKDVKGSMNGRYSTGVYILCATNGCSDFEWSDVSVTNGKNANKCNYKPSGFKC